MLELSRTPPQAPKIEACFACSGSEQARHTHPDFSSENSLFGDSSYAGETGWGRQAALRDPGLAVLHTTIVVHCRFYHTTQPMGEWETHGVLPHFSRE